MFARVFWICLVVLCLSAASHASSLADGRYAPRRPGEPPSYQRLQQQTYSPQSSYQQPASASRYSQPVRQVAPRSQRFAPTRPHEKRGLARPNEKLASRSVKTAYTLYKGYRSIRKATVAAQDRTTEALFVEAVEDTTSPPTLAKVVTYPIKLVANVVVEVVRTVAVDLWRY